MKLQEIFDQLSSGEFSQLSIGGAPAGVIDETNYVKLIGHINLGLTKIYTRFSLKQNRVNVNLVPGVYTYPVPAADLLKIETVLTDAGVEFPLNDSNSDYSCNTVTPSSLWVPESVVDRDEDLPEDLLTTKLEIVYRANHTKLTYAMMFPQPPNVDMELPSSHLEALLYFVASRVSNPIGMSNEFHAGNSYAAKYEAACQEIEQRGLQTDQGASNTRLARGGWV